MRPINHILLKLQDTTIKVGDKDLYIDHSFNPQDWVASYGEVVSSSSSEILPGDVAYCDYHAVLMALGNRYNTQQRVADSKYIEDEEGLKVFLPPNAVFFVEREGKLIGVNNNVIIKPIFELPHLYATERAMTNLCEVLSGEHTGKKVYFRPQRIRSVGRYGYNSKDHYVISSDYLLAEAEE